MTIEIQQIEIDLLAQYAAVPISFKVESVLRVDALANGLGGLALVEEQVALPYVKDYDGYDGCDGGDSGPLQWPQQFDVHNWGLFLALDSGQPVGGAAVATDTPDVNMLERRQDLAVLWDIRVHPDMRGRGIGSRLFRHAVDWARQKGCKQFKVETQNINVPACRFYAKQGCELGAIHRYGYASCPAVAHEAMLLWYINL
jgi:GNAT superfamily N-acetyltransferase